MGRYEEASVGSRPDFFITGVIDASLKPAGKRPDTRERLKTVKSSATNGAMMSEMRFMTYVEQPSLACYAHFSRTY